MTSSTHIERRIQAPNPGTSTKACVICGNKSPSPILQHELPSFLPSFLRTSSASARSLPAPSTKKSKPRPHRAISSPPTSSPHPRAKQPCQRRPVGRNAQPAHARSPRRSVIAGYKARRWPCRARMRWPERAVSSESSYCRPVDAGRCSNGGYEGT